MGHVTSIPHLFFLLEYCIKAFLLGLELDLPDNLQREQLLSSMYWKLVIVHALVRYKPSHPPLSYFLSQCLNSCITFGFFVSSPILHQHRTSASSFHLQFTINIIYQNINTISIQYCSKTTIGTAQILNLDLSLSVSKKQFSITPLSFG